MTYGQRQTAFIQAACLPENSDTTAAARVARPADAARSSAFTGLLQMLAVSLFAAILLTLAGTPVNAWATESAASAEDAAEAATPTATAAAPTDLEATAAAPAASPAATPTEAPTADAATDDVASLFAGGSGTAADPYQIATVDQLVTFRDTVNRGNSFAGKTITLTSDLDISALEWTPIGASIRKSSGVNATSTPFTGTFDGAGHEVRGLTIAPTAQSSHGADYCLGFFGAVLGGTVSNLKLTDASITDPANEIAGAAVGLLGEGGTVSGVEVTGALSTKCGTGGVVGRMTARGTISHCTNNATVTISGGSGNCGGIVGAAYYTPEGASMTIEDCTNHGTITGLNDTGGIASLCCAFVSNCTNDGIVKGNGYATGGIAGELKNYGGIIAATGEGVGGIVGVLYSAGTVTGNENLAATLSGTQFIGGIVGNLQDQGAASLPSSVPEGAQVVNNISSTPVTSLKGALVDLIAYNNDPSLFTVQGNGTAWVAQNAAAGNARYATVVYAVENASDGNTISLIADSAQSASVVPGKGTHITLDLNGHALGFAPNSNFDVDDASLTITGTGDVYQQSSDGAYTEDPQLFDTAADTATPGTVVLEGGTYPEDVSAYVAPDYTVKTLDTPDAYHNQYVVLAATPDKPTEPTNPDTPTGPDTPTNPDTPITPDNPNQPTDPHNPGNPGTPDNPGSQGGTTGAEDTTGAQNQNPASESEMLASLHSGSTTTNQAASRGSAHTMPQMGDQLGLGTAGLIALGAGITLVLLVGGRKIAALRSGLKRS